MSVFDLSMEQYIVGATGIGYFLVGMAQLGKGDGSNAMIWLGYSFSQIGLWLNLK
jgi:hypothetical protein